jgi:NAD(P)-dependent dehydrogenase (short-subunit alcohol dehydrogenase family)
LATAREFARRGARVMLGDIDQSALNDAVETLRAEGIDAHGTKCDVRKLDDVGHFADEAFRVFGDVHVVFNNAGIAYAGPIAQTSHDDWRFVIDVDLWGPIHGVEAFLPRLIAQQADSHMVFTSSFAGLIPNVGLAPYCVAKYGVVALMEVLHRELRGHGIGASVLCPMRVRTNIDESGRNRQRGYGGPEAQHYPKVEDGQMAGRVIDVAEVAALVLDGIRKNRLYLLPHTESRAMIRRRFERIDRAFEE